MKEKILGLDIGITSVGFAVVEYDDEKFEGQIKDKGVRIFEACEVAKTKESLNAKRREYRGMRRRLSRRSNRLKAIKQLFIKNNYLPEETINNLFCNSANKIDVWNLRKEALQRKLTNEEFYRIVHQIAKRRGFKSIRKSEEAKNEGQLLTNIKQNCELFENSDYQTIGEMFATIYTGDNAKRNKRDEYKNSVPRELLQDELKIIFKKQREFHLECANLDFEEDIMDIAFYQRPLKSMKEMVGYCTFEKNEKRAPKAAYTSEIFTAAQKLVNLKYINPLGEEFSLNAEQSKVLINAAHKIKKVTYKRAKKELGFDENIRFKGINYSNKDKDPETTALIELKKYHEFKDAIGENDFYNIQDVETIFNNIAEVLTYEKSDEAIVAEMKNKNIPDNIIEKVKDCSASKVMHLSIKAMKNIIPYMLDGNKYHEACQLAGYDFKNEIISKGLNYLPVLPYEELTTNPVVNRAISQTRKVVNALIKKHEKYDKIKIETARDLGKSIDERNKIKRGQDDFQKKKEEAKKRCIENGVNPDSKNNLLRYRLWEEQSGKCVYSQRPIDIRRLSEPNYTDIDHIIPYSKSLDDSLNNKVLCLSDENRQKGNKIPYDYLSSKINWEEYVSWIRSLNLPKAKTSRLTRTTYSDEKGFISRNLNDTRYITIFIKDYLKSYLDFGKNFKIETRNGSLTAFLRNQWGLDKNRAENDKHHALDAIVLACSTQGMVKYLSTISAKRENYDFINNSKPKFKTPWETFRQDVDEALSNIFVSRMLSAKIPGGIHEATYRSPKYINEGFTTLKTDIHTIDLKKLELLFDKERNYKVYDILKSRLEQANNDPKIAFKEPVYMPLSKEKQEKGIKPHPIKTVKLKDNSISGIVLPQGFAKNDSMPRVDVFTKKNKKGKVEFYLVPIYVADFAKGILPNRAITCNKSQQDWTEIDDTFEFQFSLFKNTPVLINKTGKPEDDKFYYYKSTDIDSGRIVVINIDNSNSDTKIRFSVKGLEKFKKYQVDVLGKYSEVKQEKRQNISLKDK